MYRAACINSETLSQFVESCTIKALKHQLISFCLCCWNIAYVQMYVKTNLDLAAGLFQTDPAGGRRQLMFQQ